MCQKSHISKRYVIGEWDFSPVNGDRKAPLDKALHESDKKGLVKQRLSWDTADTLPGAETSCIFFWEDGSNWDLRTQALCSIALYPSFKFIGGYSTVQPIPRATILLSLASFIWSGSILVKPMVCILIFSNTRHSHKLCSIIQII